MKISDTGVQEMRILGANLYRLRVEARMSQVSLGRILKYDHTTICRLEKGERKLPPNKVKLLSRYFQADLSQVLFSPDFDPRIIVIRWLLGKRFKLNSSQLSQIESILNEPPPAKLSI